MRATTAEMKTGVAETVRMKILASKLSIINNNQGFRCTHETGEMRGNNMKREPTAEQKAKAAERRACMQDICRKIKAMSDGERAHAASSMQVHTVEGLTLSPHNQIMIMYQKPDSTIVAGFRQWKNAGRSVKRGEHGLGIWCPRFASKDSETESAELQGFLFGTVFDVTQTEEAGTLAESEQVTA